MERFSFLKNKMSYTSFFPHSFENYSKWNLPAMIWHFFFLYCPWYIVIEASWETLACVVMCKHFSVQGSGSGPMSSLEVEITSLSLVLSFQCSPFICPSFSFKVFLVATSVFRLDFNQL